MTATESKCCHALTTLKDKRPSRGPGAMERYVLRELEHQDASTYQLYCWHPKAPPEGKRRAYRSFMSSLNRAIRNLHRQKKIEPSDMVGGEHKWHLRDEEELASTAHHEAGHAVLYRAQKLPVKYVTIILEAEIVACMAGVAAQRRWTDLQSRDGKRIPQTNFGYAASGDNQIIRTALSYLVYGHWEPYVQGDPAYNEARNRLKVRTDALVEKHWNTIHIVAKHLLHRKKFDGKSVDWLIALVDRMLEVVRKHG